MGWRVLSEAPVLTESIHRRGERRAQVEGRVERRGERGLGRESVEPESGWARGSRPERAGSGDEPIKVTS